jgi:tRNA threonylcarbamoyladenosine biosynthesis protein TsaB
LNLLAFDTSTVHAALAVARTDGATFAEAPDPTHRHGRSLVPAVRDLLRMAGLSLHALDAIAVGLGPGSYTGLRVGLTAAKTLAYAARRPLVGLDSLEVIAQNAPAEATHVAAVADAQRGDVFVAEFTRAESGGPLVRTNPTRVEPRQSWLAGLRSGTIVLGPGVAQFIEPLPSGLIALGAEAARPAARHLLALALDAARRGEFLDPWFLEPVYLRRSAAEDLWDMKPVGK